MTYTKLSITLIDRLTAQAATKGEIVSGIYWVTPEVAEEILTTGRNKDNFRNSTDSVIIKYAAFMQEGEWTDALSLLVFDAGGLLQDGQQRLAAVAASKVTVAFVFAFGHEPEVKFNVDSGHPRTSTQVLTYIASQRGEDGKFTLLPPGTVNAYRLYRGLTDGLTAGSLKGTALIDAWEAPESSVFKGAFTTAAAFVADKAKLASTSPAVLVAFYARLIAAGCRQQDIEEFIAGLAGINVPEKDARREAFLHLKKHNTTGRGGETFTLRILFYAWNRWLRDVLVSKFAPPKDGPALPAVILTERTILTERSDDTSGTAGDTPGADALLSTADQG